MLSIAVRGMIYSKVVSYCNSCFTLLSNIFLLLIRSPRFLFRLYSMVCSCSNDVIRFRSISNKRQCLLSFLHSLMSYHMLRQNKLYSDFFLLTLVLVMPFFQFLKVTEIVKISVICWFAKKSS